MGVYKLLVALVGVRLAMRVAAVMSLATIYTACVIYFSTMIVPWLEGLFSSAYGQLLGLLFPPISGTVLASLGAYWTCVAGAQYVGNLMKIAVGK
jgi:hypothetical protein